MMIVFCYFLSILSYTNPLVSPEYDFKEDLNHKKFDIFYEFSLEIESLLKTGIIAFKEKILEKRKDVLDEKFITVELSGEECKFDTNFRLVKFRDYYNRFLNFFKFHMPDEYVLRFNMFFDSNNYLLSKDSPADFLIKFAHFFDNIIMKHINNKFNMTRSIYTINETYIMGPIMKTEIITYLYESVGNIKTDIVEYCNNTSNLEWESAIDKVNDIISGSLKRIREHRTSFYS